MRDTIQEIIEERGLVVALSETAEDNFILGSSSKHRLETLSRLGFIPKLVAAPNIDESVLKNELPKIYSERMAREKVIALQLQFPGENILTADTVACCGRRILPKALTDDDVEYCLNLLSGRRSRVYTSVCLVNSAGKFSQKTVLTSLKFKRLSKNEIQYYVNTKEGVNKAGGYSISGISEAFVIWMSGSYSSVVGLPAYEVVCLLKSINISHNL